MVESPKNIMFVRRGLSRVVATSLLLALLVTCAGCQDDESEIERVSVTGQVTLDGRPLKAAAIVFSGPPDESGEPTVTAYGFVEDGEYHIEADAGPAIGTAKVQFLAKPLEREELEAKVDVANRRGGTAAVPTVVAIPEKYGDASSLRVQLVSGDENRHDFQLDSRS